MAWEDLESDISDLFEDCQADTSPLGMALSSVSARAYWFKKKPRLLHRKWAKKPRELRGPRSDIERRKDIDRKKRNSRALTAELKARRAARAPIVIPRIGRPSWMEERFARRRSA